MRFLASSAVIAAFVLSPAVAMAFVWPFNPPAIPESEAVAIAMNYGVANVTDIDGTLDGDWHIEGTDSQGFEVSLTIDGATGAVEHAEMDSD